MKKIIIALVLLLGMPLVAESYVYGTTGMSVIIPTVGVGYRSINCDHGFDISGRVGTYTLGNAFPTGKMRGLYLYYPRKSFYVGTGVGAIFFPEFKNSRSAATLDGVLGWEWRKAFLQLELATPIASQPIPLPAITFGFHF